MISSNCQNLSDFVRLTLRQKRSIPLVLAERSNDAGCGMAGISRQTWYAWMQKRERLRPQRPAIRGARVAPSTGVCPPSLPFKKGKDCGLKGRLYNVATRPWDAEIVTIGPKRAARTATWVKQKAMLGSSGQFQRA